MKFSASPRLRVIVSLTMLAALPILAQTNSSTPPQLPGKVAIAQNLNTQLPLDLMLRDETGNVVRLGQYFNHGKPVLLNFMYYRCPMLCPMVMDGVTSALTELRFDIG
jgi:protein SCO1/2